MARQVRLIGLSAILGIVVVTSAASVSGQDERSAEPQLEAEASRSRGALLFQIHCASCHGLEARGDGPVSEDLRVAPADLTNLLARSDSGVPEFPAERLRLVIDGRNDVRGHGSRAMPVWGLTFQDAGRDSSQEEMVFEKIADLVEYLRTLQESAIEEAAQPED